ncbi:MAG: TonB-dependent receptor domain-containing protein [Flavobacteriaceae bacterium]
MKKIFSLLAFSAVLVASAQAQQESDSMLTQELEEVVVSSRVIDVAKERVTPVAVSTITASDVALKVGNLEFPEIMNNTPGVYATKQGGGYGDSRISLRGFSQSNTAFLINGQPVNDMENGWVYWSNWQGLTDVTSSIQIQRGLGASRLAVPSVGGTVSIFTKAADRQAGGTFAQMLGNDGYTKTTAVHNSGVNEKGWATSLLLTYWQGDGYINSTKGEGWTYFASVGYSPEGSNHNFNLTMLGAGQWHHQRDVWVSIRDYQNFGTDHKDGIDRRWNTNGGTLNGEEYNIRRNFYNKPLATFNWDWDISDNVQLNTSVYASAGRGGGTGPRGSNFFAKDIDMYPFRQDLTEQFEEGKGVASRFPDGSINFDAIVAHNRSTTSPFNTTAQNLSRYNGKLIGANSGNDYGANRAIMIRRASMNSHDWVGAISSLDIKADKFRYSLGVDLRSYTGYHYRVLNDLLGLDGYLSVGNKNNAGTIIETTVAADPFRKTGIRGPKIDYYNIGLVKWAGFNGLVEYNNDDKFTSVLQAGLSSQSYQRVDYFDQVGNPVSEVQNSPGGYLKGGANLNLNANNNVFFNAGYISRQPLFDAVFPGFANNINPDLQNEEITSVEAGYGYASSTFKLNANVYSTVWGNRFISRGFTLDGGTSGTAQFKDVDVLHQGIELEATYYASPDFRLKGMLSAGDWKYTKDFTSEVFDDTNQKIGEGTIYIKDAKVGDAAQFVAYTEAMYRVGDISFDLGYRFVDGLYADYSIVDSAFLEADNAGAVKLPSYGLVDFGAMARFDLFGNNASFRVNINNLFDTVYIAESNSNIHATSGSQTWNGVDVRNSVWFGFGRTWNATLRVNL